MTRKFPNIERIKDRFLVKKKAAKLLLLARESLTHAQEYDNSHMMERALEYCEFASTCLDTSENGILLEWDCH